MIPMISVQDKKCNGSYSLDCAQYNVAMVIIWIDIYRFLFPCVRDGVGGNIKIKVPRK